jgi:hypothetical protein
MHKLKKGYGEAAGLVLLARLKDIRDSLDVDGIVLD